MNFICLVHDTLIERQTLCLDAAQTVMLPFWFAIVFVRNLTRNCVRVCLYLSHMRRDFLFLAWTSAWLFHSAVTKLVSADRHTWWLLASNKVWMNKSPFICISSLDLGKTVIVQLLWARNKSRNWVMRFVFKSSSSRCHKLNSYLASERLELSLAKVSWHNTSTKFTRIVYLEGFSVW